MNIRNFTSSVEKKYFTSERPCKFIYACYHLFAEDGSAFERMSFRFSRVIFYLVIIYLQKMNPSGGQLGNECRFQLRRISLNYSRGDNTPVSEDYHLVVSMSTNNSEYNVITSNRFGKVSLGYWKDCGAWFKISPAI